MQYFSTIVTSANAIAAITGTTQQVASLTLKAGQWVVDGELWAGVVSGSPTILWVRAAASTHMTGTRHYPADKRRMGSSSQSYVSEHHYGNHGLPEGSDQLDRDRGYVPLWQDRRAWDTCEWDRDIRQFRLPAPRGWVGRGLCEHGDGAIIVTQRSGRHAHPCGEPRHQRDRGCKRHPGSHVMTEYRKLADQDIVRAFSLHSRTIA